MQALYHSFYLNRGKHLKVVSVNISEKKGTVKKPVSEIHITGNGVTGDAHTGTPMREVSLLSQEKIDTFSKSCNREFKPGEFAENITFSDDEDISILYYYYYHVMDTIDPERKEFVILNRILPDRINTYISDVHDKVVDDINGIKIKMLSDVERAFEKPVRGFHIINLLGNSKPLLIKADDVKEANKRIMKNYNISSLKQLEKKSEKS